MSKPKAEETRYSLEAVDWMDSVWNRFYDVWLELATKHAEVRRSSLVMPEDVKETLQDAINALLKTDSESS
ncbi:MAG: hypothetical protein ACE5JS_08820 [Nitrospinota bacterium]